MNYIRIPTSAFRCEKCHDITAFVNGRMFYKKTCLKHNIFFFQLYPAYTNYSHIFRVQKIPREENFQTEQTERDGRGELFQHDESVRHSCHDHCHNCWSCLSCHVIFNIQWNHFLRVRAKLRFSLNQKLLTFITSHSLEHFCTILYNLNEKHLIGYHYLF